MSDTYVSNADGYRVSPATEDRQLEILTELAKSTAPNSFSFGTERLVLDGSGLAVGGDQICRECWLSFQTTNDVHIAIRNSGDADTGDFLVPPNIVLKIPVRNTSQIRVFGTAADLIYLMWRS